MYNFPKVVQDAFIEWSKYPRCFKDSERVKDKLWKQYIKLRDSHVPIPIRPKIVKKVIEFNCLRCDQTFEQTTKFNKLCEKCEISNSSKQNDLIY